MNLIDRYFKKSKEVCLLLKYFFLSLIFIMMIYLSFENFSAFPQGLPLINDQSLKLDLVVEGLQSPTSMAFLTDNSILIILKEGVVSKLDLSASIILGPILELSNVNSKNERGLLGIAIDNSNLGDSGAGNNQSKEFDVFLFITETGTQLGQGTQETESNNELRNRVYKYIHMMVNLFQIQQSFWTCQRVREQTTKKEKLS